MRQLKARLLTTGTRVTAVALRVAAATDPRDLCVFGGVLLVAYGAGLIFSPAGWIVAGVMLFWLGVRG